MQDSTEISPLKIIICCWQVLQERMLELSSKVEVLEGETANIHTQRRLEMKIKEVESKLELEQTTRQRLEVCEKIDFFFCKNKRISFGLR